jgi:hypothetical protein
VAYGARLESVLGATPRGFESRILRRRLTRAFVPLERSCTGVRNARSVAASLAFSLISLSSRLVVTLGHGRPEGIIVGLGEQLS